MRFRDAIEEVRSASDIVEVVSAHLPLKQAGRHLKGLCPFHAEKTPSFQVSPDKQLYYCFGCSAGGSVFDFVMKVRNYSFAEALEFLAGRAGINIEPEDSQDRATQDSARKERDELFAIHGIAKDFFRSCLHDATHGEAARAYLKERGLDLSGIEKFELGFAPDGWDALSRHLTKKGVLMSQAVQLGLVAPREPNPKNVSDYYDKFRSRIIFPIHDTKRRIIGFGGRHLSLKSSVDTKEIAKYINSPQSLLFDKSRTFYLLDQAETQLRGKREAVVVEGYLDAIAMHRAGVTQAVATLGTALTPFHGKVLSRYVDKVIALFDGDDAGRRAAQRALGPLAQNGLDGSVVVLPNEHDPDSFFQEHGAAAVQEQLHAGVPMLNFCCQAVRLAARSTRETATLWEEIVKTLRQVPNRLQREMWLQEFSKITGFSQESLKNLRHQDHLTNQYQRVNDSISAQATPSLSPSAAPEIQRGEEELLLCLAFESEAVYEMLRSYEGPPLMQHPLLREVMAEQFVRGKKSAGDIVYVLESIQDEELRKRLQACLFDATQMGGDSHLKAARDCMRKILKRSFEMRMRELSEKIKLAQSRDDAGEINNLLLEKSNLLRHGAV